MIQPKLIKFFHSIFVVGVLFGSSVTTRANEIYANPQFNYDFGEFIYWIKTQADQKRIPGAALAIVSREGIMYLQTWGEKAVTGDSPVTTNSIFRIASMSKTFAGTAAALLVDDNHQSWDTKLIDLFPQIRIGTGSSSQRITLKHLVSHSTGLMPHSYSVMGAVT